MTKRKVEVDLVERNGRTFSKRTEFHDNGEVSLVGIFTCGSKWAWNVPTGVVKSYFANGRIKSEISYNEAGSLDGESLYYNDKGEIVRRVIFSNDQIVKEENYEEAFEKKIRE